MSDFLKKTGFRAWAHVVAFVLAAVVSPDRVHAQSESSVEAPVAPAPARRSVRAVRARPTPIVSRPTPIVSRPTPAVAGPSVLTLDVDEGQILRLSRPAATVFVANPAVADVQAPQPSTVLILGKKPGRTTVIALDANGGEIARHAVNVTPGLGSMRERLTLDYPDLNIAVEGTPTSVIVSGRVDTPEQARGVVELIKAYAPDPQKVVNRLNLAAEVQVQLRVYIAEVSRTAVEQFGVDWQAVFKSGENSFGFTSAGSSSSSSDSSASTSSVNSLFQGAVLGKWTISTAFNVLGKRGLATVLAEPSLTAISGQTASFLAGGEIPVVMSNNDGAMSVTYKEYGVRLSFTPTVLSHDRINLAVKPEVSQLSDQGAVEVSDLTIPALKTRRVDTTVELGSGDSFVIGGLLQNARSGTSGNRVPLLADLPIIGSLFQSQTYQNDESELVVMVTPYIVRPTKPGVTAIGTNGNVPASDVERLMTGPVGDGGTPRTSARLKGRAGFSY